MSSSQIALFTPSPEDSLPEGFAYRPDVISAGEESRLLAEITLLPFKEFQFHGFEGKRRVVSFGWRYDFSQHKAMPAEPIPEFLRDLCHRVQRASGFALPRLEQVLVTEYAPGAPIGWHKDRPAFGNVMGLSLCSACTFRLRKSDGKGRWHAFRCTSSLARSMCFQARRGGLGNTVFRRWRRFAIRSHSETGELRIAWRRDKRLHEGPRRPYHRQMNYRIEILDHPLRSCYILLSSKNHP